MTSLNMLVISNGTIGVCFSIVSIATAWLFFHRHRDWPKSWVLLLVGFSIGSCGLARLVHSATYYNWPGMSSESMTLADCVSALFAFVCALLTPWAVYSIRKLPTPSEIKENAIKAGRSIESAAYAAKMAQEKELAIKAKDETQNRMVELKSLLDHANLDPPVRERILSLVERKGE